MHKPLSTNRYPRMIQDARTNDSRSGMLSFVTGSRSRLSRLVVSAPLLRTHALTMNVPQALSLRMSDRDTIRFLELYQSESTLWDPSNQNYKNREFRVAACRRIAKTLNLKDFNQKHVMIKFKNLRSSYAQELKKIAESERVGCRGDDVYTPKVFWFNVMDSFLKPYVSNRKIKNNDNTDMVIVEHSPSHQLYQDIKFEPRDAVDMIENAISQEETHYSTIQPPAVAKRRSENATIDNVKKTKIRSTENINEDCYDNFGKYLASVLRSFPIDNAFKLKGDIMNLVLNAQYVLSSKTNDTSIAASSSYSPADESGEDEHDDLQI